MSITFCDNYVYPAGRDPTIWPVQPFPGNYFSGWDSQRRFKAQQAWNVFEQVESADAATRVRLSGTGWTPPPIGVFAADPSIWYNLAIEGALTLYRLGKSLHEQVCPDIRWKSQRSYGISATPVTNVYPGLC